MRGRRTSRSPSATRGPRTTSPSTGQRRTAPPRPAPTTSHRLGPPRSRIAGATSQTINIPIIGDLLDEANETFTVNLSNPTPAATADITTPTGTGTINDNDPTPSLVINDVSQTEGNVGTTNANFAVTLSAPSGRNVTVNYATANGTAVQPGDYTTTSGTLTFAPGQVVKTVPVPIVGDLTDEPNETYVVNLSGATNATIADTRVRARSSTTTRRRRSPSTTSRSPRATPGRPT